MHIFSIFKYIKFIGVKMIVGITETYDPCYVKDFESMLTQPVNIVITKELTDELIDICVRNKNKVILHHTVTGHGGTIVEPNVKSVEHEFNQFKKLIDLGFYNYVLRVDPFIPYTSDLLMKSFTVLDMWHDFMKENFPKLKLRTRISVIDSYPHVIKRFEECGIKAWERFKAPLEVFGKISEMLVPYTDTLSFEACAESDFSHNAVHIRGCASQLDLAWLGYTSDDAEEPEKKQRSTCNCIAKKQILKVKPGRCPHQCVYCYWKN